jgi:hypothetical protein
VSGSSVESSHGFVHGSFGGEFASEQSPNALSNIAVSLSNIAVEYRQQYSNIAVPQRDIRQRIGDSLRISLSSRIRSNIAEFASEQSPNALSHIASIT